MNKHELKSLLENIYVLLAEDPSTGEIYKGPSPTGAGPLSPILTVPPHTPLPKPQLGEFPINSPEWWDRIERLNRERRERLERETQPTPGGTLV